MLTANLGDACSTDEDCTQNSTACVRPYDSCELGECVCRAGFTLKNNVCSKKLLNYIYAFHKKHNTKNVYICVGVWFNIYNIRKSDFCINFYNFNIRKLPVFSLFLSLIYHDGSYVHQY